MSSPAEIEQLRDRIQAFRKAAANVILDKEREIQLALCCLLARGHLLIEDMPGMGKTTLVHTIARLFDLKLSRIQFTNDLLPADILGSSIYDPQDKKFHFHPGPIFSELILADELNRATPKTQSACLQAMEERKVTVDGVTRELPDPFVFIATQNPKQQIGTFLLPESQLDRFLMRIEMGYPNREAEKTMLRQESRQELVQKLVPVLTSKDLVRLQQAVKEVHASDALIGYLQDIVAYTREGLPVTGGAHAGLSPRATLGFLNAAKSWAFLQGRANVLPEDVQTVGPAVMSHRLNPSLDLSGKTGSHLAQEVLAHVAVD
ncbi:MAG: MoxR family ATPase [Bdellovibrionales bacterium]|nr:MoxR family ATPase [Bdellovibrionales bacterium]